MTTRSEWREINRDATQTRDDLIDRAVRYEWDRSERSERELRAAAAEFSLALLRSAQIHRPETDFGPGILVLETFLAGCRSV